MSWRLRPIVIATAFVVLNMLAPRAAYAQDAIDHLLGRLVTSISIEVEGRPASTPALVAMLSTHVGAPLSAAELQASIAQLFSVGHFDEISIAGRTDGPGVALTYRLTPPHPIDQITFNADTGVSSDTLTRALKDQFNGIPTRTRKDAAVATVVQALKEDGFLSPHVTADVVPTHNPDRATLAFNVVPGPRAHIRHIVTTGTSPFSSAQLIARTKTGEGSLYRPSAITAALNAVAEDLRKRGNYEATATYLATPVDGGTDVDVAIDVEVGGTVTLKFAGDPLPDGKPDDYVPIQQNNSADQDLLEDGTRRIETALKGEGYWRATAPFTKTTDGTKTVITFTIARGARFRLNQVRIAGNQHFDERTLVQTLNLTSAAPYDASKVAAGAAHIISDYLAQGYASVKVVPVAREVAGSVTKTDGLVDVDITIDEGPQTRIAGLSVDQHPATDSAPIAALSAVPKLHVGDPYVEVTASADRDALLLACRNDGYEGARVDLKPVFSDDRRSVALTYDVIKGPQIIVGQIIVVGNSRTKESTIRGHLKLHEGSPLGLADRQASMEGLQQLGLFRSVHIDEASHPAGQSRVDVVVTVDEAPATTLSYGGGIQAGRLPAADGIGSVTVIAPRASFDIGRRDLWGKNRSVNFSSSASVPLNAAGTSFTEYDLGGTFVDPGVLGWNADALAGVTLEQAARTTFDFLQKGVNAEILKRTASHFNVIGRYSLDTTKLFNARIAPADQLLIDRVFPQVRLSTFTTNIVHDTRNDPVAPVRGTLFSVEGDVAARAIGSQVGFSKTFIEALGFHAIGAKRRVVLAGAARFGLAWGFPRQTPVVDSSGQPILGADGQGLTQTIDEVPASQRFFAGGATTVRGFEQDTLGVPGILSTAGLSNGGNGLAILNAEIRAALWGPIGGVGFVDTGNVFAKAGDISPGDFRTSAGLGVRFKSPIGPLRFDVGFKLGALRSTDHGRAEFAFSIGEAF